MAHNPHEQQPTVQDWQNFEISLPKNTQCQQKYLKSMVISQIYSGTGGNQNKTLK